MFIYIARQNDDRNMIIISPHYKWGLGLEGVGLWGGDEGPAQNAHSGVKRE